MLTKEADLGTVIDRLERLEAAIRVLVEKQPVRKDYYSVEEVAQICKRQPATVRGWLRDRRAAGIKKPTGRGRTTEWAISFEELQRLMSLGIRELPED